VIQSLSVDLVELASIEQTNTTIINTRIIRRV